MMGYRCLECGAMGSAPTHRRDCSQAIAAELTRIRRMTAAGVISYLEAAELAAAAALGEPTSMVHALGRLPLVELQARWLLLAEQGKNSLNFMPPGRDQLVAAIVDRTS